MTHCHNALWNLLASCPRYIFMGLVYPAVKSDFYTYHFNRKSTIFWFALTVISGITLSVFL